MAVAKRTQPPRRLPSPAARARDLEKETVALSCCLPESPQKGLRQGHPYIFASGLIDCGGAALHQRVDVELEDPGRVEAQNLCAHFVGQITHLALDRLRRMRP